MSVRFANLPGKVALRFTRDNLETEIQMTEDERKELCVAVLAYLGDFVTLSPEGKAWLLDEPVPVAPVRWAATDYQNARLADLKSITMTTDKDWVEVHLPNSNSSDIHFTGAVDHPVGKLRVVGSVTPDGNTIISCRWLGSKASVPFALTLDELAEMFS